MRILNWNIRSGGGKNVGQIIDRTLIHAPDIVVYSEFRTGNGQAIVQGLAQGGFRWIETSHPKEKENGLLVASRLAIVPSECDAHDEDPQRWLALYSPELDAHLVALHIPGAPDHKFINGVGISGGARKKLFWEKLITFAEMHRSERLIFVGDFNTGLKADSEGTPFLLSKYMTTLGAIGFVDTWRSKHAAEKEFTWYSKRKVDGVTRDFNGFRLDYIFVSPALADGVVNVFHSHKERLDQISDHSIVICDLDFEND